VHFPNIDPVLVQIGPFAIRWYALAYVATILLGWRYILSMVRNPRLWAYRPPPATGLEIDDLILWLTLGVIVGSSALVYHGLYPLLIAFNSIPKVAVVPILVIWFGIGTLPAVITSFLISFFPITVNVAAGIATVEPELRDVLRALGAHPLVIVRKVGLPRSMPYYFASLKLAITSSFLGSILAETVAGQSGIGHLMIVASARFEVPLVFAGLIVTAVMSVTMYTIATLIETRTIAWATRNQNDLGVTSGN